jgi:methylamine dehydrogenase accessory protein MauD
MDIFTISYLILWAVVLLEAIALVVVLRAVGNLYLGSRGAIERDGLELDTTAPDFKGTLADGSTFDSRHLAGRWRVFLFALPTCQICRKLLPELRGLTDELGDEVGVHVLVRGTPSLAAAFAGSVPSPNVVAISDAVATRGYRVRVSPYATVLDPNGQVRAKGLVDRIEHVEHLLQEAGVRNAVTLRHEVAERQREATSG